MYINEINSNFVIMKDKKIEVTTISKEESKMEPYIVTYSGKRFYYDNITTEMINIIDIAHSLSLQCRFNGHTKEFYSVAQHSVLVSDAQNTLAERRAGLLHDATEAYISDLPSPMKICTNVGDYKKLENRIHAVINEKYKVDDGMTENIKKADLQALFTEQRDVLLHDIDWGWGYDIERFKDTIIPLSPKEAKELFMERFKELFPIEFINEIVFPKF